VAGRLFRSIDEGLEPADLAQPMSPLGITLLMLAGFAGFGWLAWRKLAIVVRLQPEVRWDHPAARLKAVLVNGFLQQRMIAREPKAGVMHAVIFLGFMALLLRKLQLIAIGYHEPFVYPGLAGGLFAALKDFVELAVLAALAYAFWRRYVLKPRRLEPNREALLVLSLILVIMLTDLAYDGFRFALFSASDAGIAHERDYAFAGSAIAAQLAGWSPAALQAGYHLSYWVQLITVFSFLVILPTGEHFHIATALPALFFRRGRPGNVVPAVDLDKMMADDADPATLKVGARTVRDLSWKDGLDAFTCTECGRCKDACPTFLTGKPLSLKWVHDGIKHHLLEQREAILAGPPKDGDDPLPPLVGAVIGEDTLWACTTCGYCEAACPIELEHLPEFFKLRQHRVLMDGEFPHELKPVFEAYESQSNPWGLPSQTRADWAKGLDVPRWTDASQAGGFDVLFYVGSAQSFDPRGQKIARALVQVLRAAGVRFAILGEAETSTGECVRRTGNEMLFQTLAAQLVETLNGLGVQRIVTADPHAYNALEKDYSGLPPVQHISEVIVDAVRSGRLTLTPGDNGSKTYIYHDPCYLGRHNALYDLPRQAIDAIPGIRRAEMTGDCRDRSFCCGGGGLMLFYEPEEEQRMGVVRVKMAQEAGADVIITACPFCLVNIEDAIKVAGLEGRMEAIDLCELIDRHIQR
jgi:Fe-S oxidoreductase